MKISDITNETEIDKQIEYLKTRTHEEPDLDKIRRELDPKQHDIFNKGKRPDKQIRYDDPDNEGRELTKNEPVARIGLSLQKYVIKIAAQFLFGNPVKIISAQDKSELEKQLDQALKKVLSDNKESALNKRLARGIFSCTEGAEHWFITEGENKHSRYGFPTNLKIKVAHWSPLNGDNLYPLFNEYMDMVAFSREYVVKKEGKDVTLFETYTDTEKTTWSNDDGDWELIETITHDIGKIPVIWGRQEETEYDDIQWIIERLEKLASNHADTNDYHSDPKILVTGSILSFAKKGEAGGIIEMEPGADAKYLSWSHAPESVKLEWDNLLEMLSTITQTPKSFFESLDNKAGGNITGVALKMKFLSAHLKVEDKKELFIEYLQRRYSVISTILAKLHPAFEAAVDEVDFEPEITPYMINDESVLFQNISTALGGRPFISLQTAIEQSGWVGDTDLEKKNIEEENLGGLEY